MNYRRHLCLVSAQPVPNVTPALDPQFKPEEVILLVSPDMKARADALQQVFQPAGVKVRQHLIDDAWDIEHVQQRVFDLLEEDLSSIALNATCGTKPMSIAAYEVFRGFELPIFYVHPETNRLIWMYPKEKPSQNLSHRIRLPQFLLAQGVKMDDVLHRQSVSKAWREVTARLIEGMKNFAPPLGTLNYLAAHTDQNLCVDISKDKRSWQALQQLIEVFAQAGVLQQDKHLLHFPDEKSRFFVNGGWLEQHVFSVLQTVRKQCPSIHDVGQGLQVKRGTVKNEIDVAFLCNNNLHVIECKTKQFKESGAEAVYKLDSLAPDLGGIRAKTMLVSFQALGSEHQERATKAKVKLCVGTQLQQLEQHLLKWTGVDASD
ncbi:MAG: DUF1887 family CARF protein [Mariprofundaceae bacterium]|nr:DUF1887 family CARF protein [Mariprofundaceae bacterium]